MFMSNFLFNITSIDWFYKNQLFNDIHDSKKR